MPFRSNQQRKFMWAVHPKIAKRWAHKPGAKNSLKQGLPKYASKRRRK